MSLTVTIDGKVINAASVAIDVKSVTKPALPPIVLVGAATSVSSAKSTAAIPVSTKGKLISTGVSGQRFMGFNIHSWAWGNGVGEMFTEVGAKAMRISRGPQETIDAAINSGMGRVLVNLHEGDTGVKAKAAYNARWGDRIIFENGNEPAPGTDLAYWKNQLAFSMAAKEGNPLARVSAFQTNYSYASVRKAFISWVLQQPQWFDSFSVASQHSYYQTPEKSWETDLVPFIAAIGDAADREGKPMEFTDGEVGWSGAVGLLKNKTGENLNEAINGITTTFVQTEEWAANYYSRFVPIAAATKKLRTTTFYALVNEGAPDPNFMNVEAHFGIFTGRNDPKPAMYVCKDLFAWIHRASEAWMFTRGAQWYVKLKVGSTNVLIAWTTGLPKPLLLDRIQVLTTGRITWNVAGDATRTTLNQAPVVTVPLGQRSIIITSDQTVDFPEFMA